MKTLLAALPEALQSSLSHIRSCTADMAADHQVVAPGTISNTFAMADQSIGILEQWLLDEEQKQVLALNPLDVFLLYASTYLCDIDQSGRFITNHWKGLGIDNAAQAAIIADICSAAGCRDGFSEALAKTNTHSLNGTAVNTALLSAAIRLAQELNPKAPATIARILGDWGPSATPSDKDFAAAFAITAAGPHPYLTATIQVKIQCRDADIHRALKRHERAVQKQLHQINQMASPRFLYSDVIFEIEADGYTPVDLKFSVDNSAALKLLTGNRLYSDNRVFLRELIQNAVDACNLRKRLESDYKPAISIQFNHDISVVTVRDNGIGMDRQWIEKYFLTIGISLYQSSEIRSASGRSRIDFNFISQFGIGFLSSFLVADKIIIKTRKAGRSGLRISITNLKDYFDVRPLDSEFEPGTEVTLHLKPSKINYCRSLEYTGYLKTNIRYLNIPVEFTDQTGQTTTIGRQPLSFENPKTADIDFIAPLAFQHSEGYLLLRAKKNVDHIFTLESAKGGVSVFQDGIFITQLDTLLPEGARQHVVGRINLLGRDKCALSMDRNRIFWSENQLREVKNTIRMGLAKATHWFLNAVDNEKRVSENTRQSIINHLAIFFDFNKVDDAVHEHLSKPIRQVVEKRFRDFVRIHFAHTHRPEGIPEADGYSNIWQQRIVNSFRKN